MFTKGNSVVYPGHGVARITAIKEETIGDFRQSYYILETETKTPNSRQLIKLPVEKAEANGMRMIISEDDVPKVLEILSARGTKTYAQAWNRRLREYREALKTGSIFSAAEIFRDLSVLKETKDLSFSERRLFNEARSLVIDEVAIARKTPPGDIERMINEIIGKPEASEATSKD